MLRQKHCHDSPWLLWALADCCDHPQLAHWTHWLVCKHSLTTKHAVVKLEKVQRKLEMHHVCLQSKSCALTLQHISKVTTFIWRQNKVWLPLGEQLASAGRQFRVFDANYRQLQQCARNQSNCNKAFSNLSGCSPHLLEPLSQPEHTFFSGSWRLISDWSLQVGALTISFTINLINWWEILSVTGIMQCHHCHTSKKVDKLM